MLKNVSILLILLCFAEISAFASHVKGSVKDESGAALPFGSVYVKSSTYGVTTNENGAYFMELAKGDYTLVFSYIGYETLEKKVSVTDNWPITLHVNLKRSLTEIAEIEVVLNPKKHGRSIIRKAIEKRREYLTMIESYQCETYLKSSLKKELANPQAVSDSIGQTVGGDMKDHLKKEKLNLVESVSEVFFEAPGKYKQIIKGHHDYAEESNSNVNVRINFSDDGVIPEQGVNENPYILYKNVTSGEFEFYKNSINFPGVSQKPILSPIASTAMLSYNYNYDEPFMENGKKIYKIEVIPRIKTEALFSGFIYIEDSTWALVAVDLAINKEAMYMCKHFQIIQNYEAIDGKYYLPVRREFVYTIRDGKHHILGNTRVHHENYKVNVDFGNRFFGNELLRYEEDAFDKDSTYWDSTRTIELEEEELTFIHRTDSISNYYVSDEYYAKIDSAFNKVNWWSIFNGVGHINRKKGTEFWINGVMEQPRFFGIGGYRHSLSGYFNKDFKERNISLETDGMVDYGFNNQDLKGELGVGLTYLPLKFLRTYVRVGDVYDMINNYESVQATFSRSNYVRKKTIEVSQRMEIVNGLFAEVSFNLSDQIPIDNMEFANWSNKLFGALNVASSFNRYKKSEVKLVLRYRPMQKYIIKKGRKLLLGSKYPEFFMEYRKGIKGLFDSEVDYDYLELGAGDDVKLKRFGTSRWQVSMGTYLNENNLRFLEYKFFRGSDKFFFSDPVLSFQLLPLTMNTNKEWYAMNYIHHFEGSLLSKVPVLNKAKLQLAAGAGSLGIRNANFLHFEMFGGVEKALRIKKELFRLGAYAVTSSNTIERGMDLKFKFGITYYNPFTQKWGY